MAGYYPVDATGRFLSRDALPEELIVTHVAGAIHRRKRWSPRRRGRAGR